MKVIDPTKFYIIGGIVDHNRHKAQLQPLPYSPPQGLTHERATKLGISTARLPIGEYLKVEGRKVLTVNQVFDILLQFLEHGDWLVALHNVIPQRKNPEPQIKASAENETSKSLEEKESSEPKENKGDG